MCDLPRGHTCLQSRSGMSSLTGFPPLPTPGEVGFQDLGFSPQGLMEWLPASKAVSSLAEPFSDTVLTPGSAAWAAEKRSLVWDSAGGEPRGTAHPIGLRPAVNRAINHGQVQLACRPGPKPEATFSFGHPRARKPVPERKREHVLPT